MALLRIKSYGRASLINDRNTVSLIFFNIKIIHLPKWRNGRRARLKNQ